MIRPGERTDSKAAPLRVGYLLRMYPRFSQTFVVNEILELERQGVDVRIVSLRKPDEGMFHETVARVKARAHYLPETALSDALKHLSTQWNLLRRAPGTLLGAAGLVARHRGAGWFDLLQAGHLLRWARKQAVEHVHVHFGTNEATTALLANRLGGLSFSMTLHAFDIFRDNVDRALLARKINASRFTVTVCESNRRYILEHIPGVDPAKVRVNYNGIDLTRFAPGEGPREPLSVFGVGRLIEKKGFVHLVRAVARLKQQGMPVIGRIAGDGPERRALGEEIERLGLAGSVKLLGSIREDRVRELMQRSACFVLPCVQARDGNVDALPTVLLEAMACGCPVISTRLSGVPEIIESQTSGLLVEPGDEGGLAEAMHRVLSRPLLAESLAREGRLRAERRFNVAENVRIHRHWLADAPVPAPAVAPAVAALAHEAA
ncbi:MAG: glycosyltransferase [Planctomycetes bacterium]|nr:glycosyltransferase [Planctomycetota bacterium]